MNLIWSFIAYFGCKSQQYGSDHSRGFYSREQIFVGKDWAEEIWRMANLSSLLVGMLV